MSIDVNSGLDTDAAIVHTEDQRRTAERVVRLNPAGMNAELAVPLVDGRITVTMRNYSDSTVNTLRAALTASKINDVVFIDGKNKAASAGTNSVIQTIDPESVPVATDADIDAVDLK